MQSRVNRKIEPELLGVAEAEEMTGRSRWSWRRDCYSGAIASVKIGRRLLIPIAEVRRVIAENTRPRLNGSQLRRGKSMKKLILASALCAVLTATAQAQGVAFYTQGATTTKVNLTPAAPGSKATTSVHLQYVMPDTSYAASCSLVDAIGLPYIEGITKFTDHIVVTISNRYSDLASGASEIDCIVTGSSK
jgi:hypothetical protein